jgi:GTP-binding protein
MEIRTATYLKSSEFISQCPEHRTTEYAFIGRSNVGKSSLINMLAGNSKLAKTSSTPGKTLLINHFVINNGEWYLVDLPGYGFAKRSKTERAKLEHMIEGYILQRECLTNLFVLIDSRLEPQAIDLAFMRWLGESGIAFSIVFTKADKLSRQRLSENINAYLDKLREEWDPLPPYFITSAETRQGRDELLEYIDSINKTIDTQP